MEIRIGPALFRALRRHRHMQRGADDGAEYRMAPMPPIYLGDCPPSGAVV
jgi:hypothetical protein